MTYYYKRNAKSVTFFSQTVSTHVKPVQMKENCAMQ